MAGIIRGEDRRNWQVNEGKREEGVDAALGPAGVLVCRLDCDSNRIVLRASVYVRGLHANDDSNCPGDCGVGSDAGRGAVWDVQARVDAVFARFTVETPGCALGVVRAGVLVHAKGYGQASLELGVPITPATVFAVGSASKQITAALIVRLAFRCPRRHECCERENGTRTNRAGCMACLSTHSGCWRDS
jgi:hypothetical protein